MRSLFKALIIEERTKETFDLAKKLSALGVETECIVGKMRRANSLFADAKDGCPFQLIFLYVGMDGAEVFIRRVMADPRLSDSSIVLIHDENRPNLMPMFLKLGATAEIRTGASKEQLSRLLKRLNFREKKVV